MLFIWFLLFQSLYGRAQLPVATHKGSNLRVRKFRLEGDSLRIDTLSIVPGTLSIAFVQPGQYRYDPANAVLYWRSKPLLDSVQVTYRVFPFHMAKVQQRMSFDSLVAGTAIKPLEIAAPGRPRSVFNFGDLQYSGSFGRGIAFGNNQDAVVQSNFNLQLNGLLADSIEIAAAITDNNLPIQPDGTTQQLNEFDQVFLQFKKNSWQLNLGDIDLRQNDLYFLNFYKRLQGITFRTKNQITQSVQSSTLVSGSIAKGKFNRNVFQGLEGNQGPYRLSGANNEFFFIVLANTERVFIDGILLQRGEDQDYIINYNTAEVSFMPRRMITKDSRIQVEFEYADRNYLNANLYANQVMSIGKAFKIKIGAFTNSDAKSSPINQPLTAPQKQFLFDIGDSIQKALYPNVAEDAYGKEKILYEKVYVSNGNALDSFYRYSTDPAVARYALSFTDFGQGRGNYISEYNGANGKVFRYVAPQNGVKQGRFEPVLLLVTPKKQQLISVGTEFKPGEHHALQTELALSDYDPNTYSSKNSSDNKALAARLDYTNTARFGKLNNTALISTLNLEHVQAGFKPLERFRNVEFSREWGLPILAGPSDETILKVGTSLKTSQNREVTYQFTSYNRSDGYQGVQNLVIHNTDLKGWQLRNSALYTRFNNINSRGGYFRPVLSLQKTLQKMGDLQFAIRYTLEQNKVKQQAKDSLNSLSFAFDTYAASLRTSEKRQNRYGLTFFTRADQYPVGSHLIKADRSYNLNFEAELLHNPKHQLVVNTTYRQLRVFRKSVSKQKEDQTLLGRAEYQINEWNGLLTGNVLYELGTGQEQRRDFTYIEVPAGQGEFAWFDYNSDGVQQLNEFEVAQFRDQARFLKVLVPTNDFIKTTYTTLNYNFTLNPKAAWDKQGVAGLKKVLTRFSIQTSLQTNRRSAATSAIQVNPFQHGLLDSALITLNTTMGNTLSFNRYASVWGVDVASFRSTAKALLTYGFESRQTSEWNARARWMISKALNFDLTCRSGTHSLFTPSFENRNYQIDFLVTEPRLTYLNGTVFRLQGSYRYEQKKNAPQWGGQTAFSHALNLETKYNVLQNSSISGRFVVNTIAFSDITNTPIAYTLLEGLLPGNNFLWTIDLTKRVLNNVELNFQYDGRQPARAKTVHTGRASLRALF